MTWIDLNPQSADDRIIYWCHKATGYPLPYIVKNSRGLSLYYVWTPWVNNYTAVGYILVGKVHYMIAFSTLELLVSWFPELNRSFPIPAGGQYGGGAQFITAKIMDCPNIRVALPKNVPFALLKKCFQEPNVLIKMKIPENISLPTIEQVPESESVMNDGNLNYNGVQYMQIVPSSELQTKGSGSFVGNLIKYGLLLTLIK